MVSLNDMKEAWESGEIGHSLTEKKAWLERKKKEEIQSTDIPKQYLHPNLRFCKIRPRTKKPFELDWVNKPYKIEELREGILRGDNYGCLCGYGGLVVIDCDDLSLYEAVHGALPKTFEVLTGGGGKHCYYFCETPMDKIILQVGDKHYGEIQSKGQQVICAGSIHPNGNKYQVYQDEEIATITHDELLMFATPYMQVVENSTKQTIYENTQYGNEDINSIQIGSVISLSGFKSAKNGEMYGSNPWHGSTGGMNFFVNPSKNIAHCFRCNAGVSVAKAIALNEKLISNCSDMVRGDIFRKVIDVACEKYGLKKGTPKFNPVGDISDIQTTQTTKKVSKKVERNVQELMRTLQDKMAVAEQFNTRQPIYYDYGGIFWLWNSDNQAWFQIDEVDLANLLTQEGANTISSTERAEIMQALKQVGRIHKPLDIPKTWIQFKNGIVDITDSTHIIDSSPNYFTVNPIPWNIGSNPDTPTMDKIFTEWVGVDNVLKLYQILAYCLLPDYPLSRIFCFVGAGMNGKSKYLELLRKFIGEENVTTTELDVLLNSRFEITRLYKKLAVMIGETNFTELSMTSILKKITGGDLIGFEYKNKNPFQAMNYAKVLIGTNNLPMTTDKTIGFFRRWLIIDFPNQFSEKKDILKDIPEQEYENLAFKSIMILSELLQKREFDKEGSIEDRMHRYEERSNPFDRFWRENVIDDEPNREIPSWEFNKRFNAWCKDNRFREHSEDIIAKQIRAKGIEQHRVFKDWYENNSMTKKQVRCWVGITWKN